MEFVDHQLTFEELSNHLKSGGCHVANMSSLDFSAKNGIGGCLTRLLRKFLTVTLDDADMSILASWYCGQRESTPVVIIIEDMERFCASVLSNFILMLRSQKSDAPKDPKLWNSKAVALIEWMLRPCWEIPEEEFKLICWSSINICTAPVAALGEADCCHHFMTLQYCK
uniref:Origin recognition complex subunit 3 N-terminal domain-containing protein n=1 Tax=Chenopodium quinoa TaxID=63459 RepID=A0A803M2A0_CHEQI